MAHSGCELNSVDVQVKLSDRWRTHAIPERFWGDDSRNGAISSVRTLPLPDEDVPIPDVTTCGCDWLVACTGGPASAAVRVDARLGGGADQLSVRQEADAGDQPAVPRHPQHAHLADDARSQQDRHHPLRDAHHHPRSSARHLRRPGWSQFNLCLSVFLTLLSLCLPDSLVSCLSVSILSYPILSYPILSCPVLSCPVLSCPVLSCPVLSYLSKKSRLGRCKCRDTTRAPNNVN